MATKEQLKEMLSKREVVTPINLYTKPQVDKPTNKQTDKDTKPQRVKQTKPQVVKYTTHLTETVIKQLKMYALENDLKDYEVMQKAVEKFLKDKK